MKNQEKSDIGFTLSIPIVSEGNNNGENIDNELKQNIEVVRSIVSEAVDAAVKAVLSEVNRLHQVLMIQMVKVARELNMRIAKIDREITKLYSKLAVINESILKLNEFSIAAISGNNKPVETSQIIESIKNLSNLVAEENVKITKAISELREILNSSTVAKSYRCLDVEAYSEAQTLLKASIEQLNELRKHIEGLNITVRELLKALRSENVIKEVRNINVVLGELALYMEELKSSMKQY